jgi:signal transduction histidine kinase/DNA-binding response OmpR family regulator
MPVGLVLACSVLIDLTKFPKIIQHLPKAIISATILLCTIIVFDYKWYWLKAASVVSVFAILFCLILHLVSLFKKYKIDWAYSAPFILGILSTLYIPLRLLGMKDFPGTNEISYIMFVAEIFVFGLFLGKIIRNYEKNKLKTENELSFNINQASKLKELDLAKTNFFSNISHEFRTPLTLLVGPLADLKKKFPQESIINTMQRNLERLQTLINQLLDLSKLEAGKMVPNFKKGDLSYFLRYLIGSFDSLAVSKEISLIYDRDDVAFITYFDADKIEKIVTNLISNAIKFTPKGGEIKVEYVIKENDFKIFIKDTGIGIEPAQLGHIFDRFYQIENTNKRKFDGTGIGLALVMELVEVLKGKIEVQSEMEKGTLFIVILPLYNQVDEYVSIEKTEENRFDTQQSFELLSQIETEKEDNELPILLIIEDNADLRSYVKSQFIDTYQIIEAVDGQDGYEKATELIPDLVICDLMMPRLDGYGFCKLVKADLRTNHIPIIMLTAKASVEARLEGFELGADDYLAKPFNNTELQVRVRNLLKNRELIRNKIRQQIAENQLELPLKGNSVDEQFLQKINVIIEKNIGDSNFDLEHLAGDLNISSAQLRRKLKAVCDQKPIEFIRNYRLDSAAKMLRNGEGNVSTIAFKVGFESLGYFSKVFYEKFGINASEYR